MRWSLLRWRQTVVPLLVVLLITGCDQTAKHVAKKALASSGPVTLGHVLTFTPAENTGAFLSLGAGLPDWARLLGFTLMVGICLGVMLWLLLSGRLPSRSVTWAMTLVVGGGLGNLIDRIFHQGRVFDFLFLRVGPVHTGVFNVADMAITAGVIVMLIASLGREKKPAVSPETEIPEG